MNNAANYEEKEKEETYFCRYRPYTISYVERHPRPPIIIDGQTVIGYEAPYVLDYVDLDTGEILTLDQLPEEAGIKGALYTSEWALQREYFLMKNMRREVREFACFVLKFRNYRRGITPGIYTLAEWFADLHERKASNVRRYIDALYEVGFLESENLLTPLFQYSGNNKAASEHKNEDVHAFMKYAILMFRNDRTLKKHKKKAAANEKLALVAA